MSPAFRNTVWNDILGSSRKRDVFLAVRALAADRNCLKKSEVATKALSFPHFRDRDKLRGGDLGDNSDLVPLRNVGAVLPIPKIVRPTVDYVVPFTELCEYLVDPYHAPTSESVRHAIEYYCRHEDRERSHGTEAEGEVPDLPVDPFAIELYTYVRLVERFGIDVEMVEFESFRPTAFDHERARGFLVEGRLHGHGVAADGHPSTDAADLMRHLERLFAEFVDYAAQGKNIFRLGIYTRPDEADTRTDARRRAIRDYGSFDVFDHASGTVQFRWEMEPAVMI
ncbi:hypothetical protein [Natronoglomus mannanivorans]|uniref:hypothetical protein n=1 Tax=Natronoglomus mannanivorans TaxID=2979990 RepID=UPI003083C1E9